jgi:hypothetical protein
MKDWMNGFAVLMFAVVVCGMPVATVVSIIYAAVLSLNAK